MEVTLTPEALLDQRIVQAEAAKEAARLACEEVVRTVQRQCPHEQIAEYDGSFGYNGWMHTRTCLRCGLTVDAQGCGFWPGEPLYVPGVFRLSTRFTSTDEVWRARRGLMLSKKEAAALTATPPEQPTTSPLGGDERKQAESSNGGGA